MDRRIRSSLLIAILLQAIPTVAVAGSSAGLSAGNASGLLSATRTVPITLNFDPEVEVTGFNFDLGFDPDRVTVGKVSLGSAASGKTLPTPTQPSPGILRVIVFGVDAIPMSEGVVVNIQFNIESGASPGTFTLALTNTALSDPSGSGISHITSNGSFTVIAPPTNTPAPASTNTPVPTDTPVPPTSTPGPSATPS